MNKSHRTRKDGKSQGHRSSRSHGHNSTIFLIEGTVDEVDFMFAEGGYPEQEGPVSNDRSSRPANRRNPTSRSSIHPDSAD